MIQTEVDTFALKGSIKISGLKICVYFLSRVTVPGSWYCHFSVYQSDLMESNCATLFGRCSENRTVLSRYHIFLDITDFKNKSTSSSSICCLTVVNIDFTKTIFRVSSKFEDYMLLHFICFLELIITNC